MRLRRRRAMVLVLVLLICGVLATIGVAAYLQSSGTGRALVRVLSIRAAIEAGDSALSEAAAAVRVSLDTGQTSSACPDDWHALMFGIMQNTPPGQTRTDPAGRTFRLVPVTTRQRISTDEVPVTIGDVTAKILNCYMPDQAGITPPNPPQGLIEMSVTVKGPGKVFDVVRTVRQRRLFYATATQPLIPGGQLDPNSVLLFLTIDPVGTAIE